jgi:hypothetical protein
LKTKKRTKVKRSPSVWPFTCSFEVSQFQESFAVSTMLASAMPYLSTRTT